MSYLSLYYTGDVDGIGADAFGEVEVQPGEDLGLVGIGPADPSELELAPVHERQNDVAALDGAKRIEDPAGGHVEATGFGKPVPTCQHP